MNGIGRASPLADQPIGPTINGVIDCRKQDNFLDGFVLEEGAVPEALAPMFQAMLESLPGKVHPEDFGFADRLRHLISRSRSRAFGPYARSGSVQRTQTYLIMSHDDNQAVLTMKDDKPYLNFMGVGRSDHVKRLNQLLADATTKIGGTFVNSPFFTLFDQKEV